MLHMYAAHTIHPYCMHAAYTKNWLSATRMPYKHMKKCMQFVCNCLHAACMLHIKKLHTCCIHVFRCVRPHVHVCGSSTHAIWVYCVCSTHVAYMHSMCSKEADNVQHTSNISVRVVLICDSTRRSENLGLILLVIVRTTKVLFTAPHAISLPFSPQLVKFIPNFTPTTDVQPVGVLALLVLLPPG